MIVNAQNRLRDGSLMQPLNVSGDGNDSGEETRERTIIAAPQRRAGTAQDERAFILFISGPLMGKMYLIEKSHTIIGRSIHADIVIHDSRISRQHARISMEGKKILIEDLRSTNGTFVNAERIMRQELKNGDKVYLPPDHVFKFAVGDEAERMFQKEMYQLANYDAVTNTSNKHVFIKQLREVFSFATSTDWGLALLMIDIDSFKNVNDSYGHPAGDHVLHGVAQRIRKTVRDEDILARYGGDEMAVILSGIDSDNVLSIAERIRTTIADRPFYFQNHVIPVTVSIGIAVFGQNNFQSVEEFIAHADDRLYRSKTNGRNRVSL